MTTSTAINFVRQFALYASAVTFTRSLLAW